MLCSLRTELSDSVDLFPTTWPTSSFFVFLLLLPDEISRDLMSMSLHDEDLVCCLVGLSLLVCIVLLKYDSGGLGSISSRSVWGRERCGPSGNRIVSCDVAENELGRMEVVEKEVSISDMVVVRKSPRSENGRIIEFAKTKGGVGIAVMDSMPVRDESL